VGQIVDLALDFRLGDGYRSRSQIARVVTQGWIGRELECLNCTAPRLEPTAQNTKARDFVCEKCDEPYELKSTAGRFGRWVNDGQYETLLDTIAHSRTPNLLLLECDLAAGQVRTLSAVHRRVLSQLAVVPRKPLGPMARRAGWRGCNIDLNLVPMSGRISIVSNSTQAPWSVVRADWSRLGFLIDLQPQEQGWIQDVLACVQQLPDDTFELKDVYEYDGQLGKLHPENRHVRPKIRQQLQQLVAKGLLTRTERGKYLRTTR
jgi:type II restriction enzyme